MKKNYTIIENFMQTIAPTFVFKVDEQYKRMLEDVLHLFLSIHNRLEVKEDVWSTVNDTFIVQTKEDCRLLACFNTLTYKTPKIYFDLKKSLIYDMDGLAERKFDVTAFKDYINKKAASGEQNACRLLACFSWLNGERNAALALWKKLAYWGDLISVKALAYGFQEVGNLVESNKWANVAIAFEEYIHFGGSQKEVYEKLDLEGKKEFDLILCVRALGWIQNKALLYFPLLDYIVQSRLPAEEVMQNISQGNRNFYVLKKSENELVKGKIGF